MSLDSGAVLTDDPSDEDSPLKITERNVKIMCIICSSPAGIDQPTTAQLRRMFETNPHGAGYMVARSGHVEISKGYMDIESFLKAIQSEGFTKNDPVVYHFRISTQAGVTPEMTHPFPLSRRLSDMTELDITSCSVGVAHNGIIPITSDRNDHSYSDTARFITRYLVKLIRGPEDLRSHAVMEMISELTHSRLAILDKTGYIAYVGRWITEENGLRFSNASYQPPFEFKSYKSIFTEGGVNHEKRKAEAV